MLPFSPMNNEPVFGSSISGGSFPSFFSGRTPPSVHVTFTVGPAVNSLPENT